MFINLRSEAGGSSASTSASPSARITSDMFQAAMLQVSVAYILQIKMSSFQAMTGAGMPGMGASQPGIGQPTAAAPLAQAETAADFSEQVICRSLTSAVEYHSAMKGGENEGDGYRRRGLGSPSFADYGRGSAGAIIFHKIYIF